MPDTGTHEWPASGELISPTLIGRVPPLEWPEARIAFGPVKRTTRSVNGPEPRPATVIAALNFAARDAPAGTRKAPRLEPMNSEPSPGLTASVPISVPQLIVGTATGSESEPDPPQ